MRTRRIIRSGLLAAGFIVATTAHAGVIRKSHKVAIQAGQMGAIIPSITPSGNKCSFGEIAFRNLQTRKFYKGKFSNPKSFLSTPRARVLPLPPGYYQPVYAECVWKTSILTQRQFYRGLDRVFQPILVRGGEVVYFGTFDILVRPGEKNYNFNLIGNTSQVYENLARSDRDLIRNFVERPIQRR